MAKRRQANPYQLLLYVELRAKWAVATTESGAMSVIDISDRNHQSLEW